MVELASSIVYVWPEIIHAGFDVAVLLYSYKMLPLH